MFSLDLCYEVDCGRLIILVCLVQNKFLTTNKIEKNKLKTPPRSLAHAAQNLVRS